MQTERKYVSYHIMSTAGITPFMTHQWGILNFSLNGDPHPNVDLD